MFELYADKNKLTLVGGEMLTSGSVGVYQTRFTFSAEWEGLRKTAVFYGACKTVSVVLDESAVCDIPWEVLTLSGQYLYVGVQGSQGEEIVLPTELVNLGLIRAGADPGEDARPPTPELWEQLLAQKGDALGYTNNGELGLYAGRELLSAVPIEAGGGEGGTTDHRRLSHRDAGEQHPIGAIVGLEEELSRIPEPAEALTNLELEEILK